MPDIIVQSKIFNLVLELDLRNNLDVDDLIPYQVNHSDYPIVDIASSGALEIVVKDDPTTVKEIARIFFDPGSFNGASEIFIVNAVCNRINLDGRFQTHCQAETNAVFVHLLQTGAYQHITATSLYTLHIQYKVII